MSKFRNADIGLIYYLREVMENNGWASDAYSVIDSYPSNLDTITKFPTVTVQSNVGDPLAIELGQQSTLKITWSIDVFGKGDGQRDDITYIIWNDLQERRMTLYDFNTGFPPTTGDYSGISTLGAVIFDDISFEIIDPDEFSTTIAEKHHSLIVAPGYLSID